MKKFYLLTKTLLVAALLMVGASNAWAGITNIFSQASWVHTHDGGSGDRDASLSFDGTSSIDDNWTSSFDVTISSTFSRTNGARNFQIALASASASFPNDALLTSNVLLGAKFLTTGNTNYSSFPCTITVNDVDEAGTVTLTHGTKYTFSVSVNGTSMTVSIKDGETSVFSKAVTLAAFVKPKGIFDLLPRPMNASYGVYTNTYSDILVTKEVTAEEVTAPSIAVAYAGANRTVTITPGVSSESNAVTTYYTLDGEDPTSSSSVYSTPLDIDADCTVKAISISSTDVASDITSQAVTVGKLKLNAPTISRSGNSVTITSDQSEIMGNPSATIYYTYGAGDPVAYSSAITVEADATISAYATATNYNNSDNATRAVAIFPTDVAKVINAPQNNTYTTGALSGDDVVGTNATFKAITIDGARWGSEDVYVQSTKFGFRNGGSGKDWYFDDTNNVWLLVKNLKAGDIIVANTSYQASSLTNATYTEKYSEGNNRAYTVTAAGDVELAFKKPGSKTMHYFYGLYVWSHSVSATFGTNGFTTFASPYPLDLTSATQKDNGFTAYRAASIAGSTVTFKDDINQNVAANTGILLKGTANATVTIPVVASGTALAGNSFHVNTSDATFDAEDGYTYYGMIKDSDPLQFGTFNPESVAIPANKAYLVVNGGELAARQIEAVFGDELTGISEAKSEVEFAKEGKFVVDGKLLIFKKGMKFNANGARIK